VGRGIDLGSLAEPAAPEPEPESADPGKLAEAVRAFWSRENGFTYEQRLEGLTSLGLGFLTGVPEIEERSRALLLAKLSAWEESMTRLRRRASEWLARLEATQREQATAVGSRERERLSERQAIIEDRLTRLRGRLARQPARLRPRPAEVQELLSAHVANVGNTRFRRIAREIVLLEDRVRSGGQALRRTLGARLLPDVASLMTDVEAHLGQPLVSPRAHGLSPAQRSDRNKRERAWLARGEELLGRIRGHFRYEFGFPQTAPVNAPILNWLADAEDYYEFGLLRRKGVIAGLGRRHGWRLERLLRTD